jgi:tetratricopeptide (TPR) repeat protein
LNEWYFQQSACSVHIFTASNFIVLIFLLVLLFQVSVAAQPAGTGAVYKMPARSTAAATADTSLIHYYLDDTSAFELAPDSIAPAAEAYRLNLRAMSILTKDAYKAHRMIREALGLAQQTGDTDLLLETEQNLGFVLSYMGDFEHAKAFYLSAEQRALALHDTLGIIKANAGLGMVFTALSDFANAERHYKIAVDLMDGRSFDLRMQVNHLIALAVVKRQNGHPVQSMNRLRKAVALSEQVQYNEGLAQAWANMGLLHLENGAFKAADSLFAKSLLLSERTGSVQGKAATYLYLGRLYLKSGNCNGASASLQKGLDIANNARLRPLLPDLYKELMLASECRGDFNAAYLWQNRYLLLTDSLEREKQTRQINAIEAYYQADIDTEKRVHQKTDDSLRQALVLYKTSTFALLSALIVSLALHVRRRRLS